MLISHQDSLLVKGVAFKKTFSYAGFEMQKKKMVNPKIALLNIELELKSEKVSRWFFSLMEIRLRDHANWIETLPDRFAVDVVQKQ